MMEDLKEEDEDALTLPFMVRLNSIEIPFICHQHPFITDSAASGDGHAE